MAKIRTRARAVDMLGRQQIAGIQNALSELFKNAHDAYADRVAVDFFEDYGGNGRGFLLVRDNGIGMTHEDFVEKWLVLGTESKATGSKTAYIPPGKKRRPVTGEKGIGRLAIALLGSQLLVLTRAERSDGVYDLVVALIHWGLFELPGLNLEEVEIPVATVPNGRLPDAAMLASLRHQLKECVEHIAVANDDVDMSGIIDEIDGFQPDLASIYSFMNSKESTHLKIDNSSVGTHFLIAPSNPVIQLELEAEEHSDDYGFRKHLLGFADRVFNDDPPARIETSFRRWRHGDMFGRELLDAATFVTRSELLEKSDHLFTGHVDKFGQFSGSLRVYEERYDNLVIPWNGSKGRSTKCGSFEVSFGYVMGRSTESRLAPEEWHALNNKLNHVGGMYVYRDGIRILPYGDYSFDWLDVEKRRNKGAAYYFFSFRRMFGAVLLTRSANAELAEKAGREGFQQNEAYRQLRDIMINLLLYLAAEFFRKDGTNAELFEAAQAEMRKRSAALERQLKRARTQRRRFAEELATFANYVEGGLPDSEINSLRSLTRARMDAASKVADQDKAAAALIRAEQEAITSLASIRKKYTRKRPTGIALGREMQRDWMATSPKGHGWRR